MELAFAGLHQLCAPMLDGLGGLPDPQRDALRVAFGLQEGAASNRFLVAVLAQRIAMVIAVREPIDAGELAGLPELAVGGLADDDARWLLASALPGRLDKHARDRIVAEGRATTRWFGQGSSIRRSVG